MINFIKNIFKTNLPAVILVGLLLSCFWFFIIRPLDGCNNKPEDSGAAIIYDSNLTVKYYETIKRDTIIKLIDKIVYKESKPVVIYTQKVDSVFFEKIKYFDFMLDVKKRGRELRVYAVNKNDSILKEYIYYDVQNDFTATSRAGSIFVKSKLWYFDGVTMTNNYQFPGIDYRDGSYSLGLKSGVNFKNTIGLEAGTEYNFKQKDFLTKASLNLKLNNLFQ